LICSPRWCFGPLENSNNPWGNAEFTAIMLRRIDPMLGRKRSVMRLVFGPFVVRNLVDYILHFHMGYRNFLSGGLKHQWGEHIKNYFILEITAFHWKFVGFQCLAKLEDSQLRIFVRIPISRKKINWDLKIIDYKLSSNISQVNASYEPPNFSLYPISRNI
jgi:hypothetical protein